MSLASTIYSYKYHILSTQNVKAKPAIVQNNEVWLRAFSYVGSHLWNSVLNDHVDIVHIDFNEFKALLNMWKGPDIFQYAVLLPVNFQYTSLWVLLIVFHTTLNKVYLILSYLNLF